MKRSGPQCVCKRSFKNFVEQAFLHELYDSDLSFIDLITDAELALQYFLSVFKSLADKHTPFKRERLKTDVTLGLLMN